ncbi:MAG: LysR family transcriptional regulator [Caulobacter sp.]|jgi:LysR family glycine cleavage system transcriptional activator|nr:LysR family transcriptional regulator [Caulobacter sp.]
MARPSIPLNALRAFEAAARHQSVKLAGLELNVSASAVSHQVRQLERTLGVALFTRDGRGVTLTPEGAALLPKLVEGFGLIEAALDEHHASRTAGALRLSVLEIFAHWWLLPRLSSYPLARRGFELEIEASQQVVSFDTENVDAAVRIGKGDWPGVVCDHLFDERMGVYGLPGIDLETAPIFISRLRQQEWRDWCASAPPVAAQAPIVLVETVSLALKAALDGAGLCFAGDRFAERDVLTGRLRRFDEAAAVSPRGGYWLVYPPRGRRDPRLRNFRTWLLAQVAAERVAP